jgi:ribonuclease G
MDRLKNEDEQLLVELERRFQGRLTFRVDPKLPLDEFKLMNPATEQEIDQKPEQQPSSTPAERGQRRDRRSRGERAERSEQEE